MFGDGFVGLCRVRYHDQLNRQANRKTSVDASDALSEFSGSYLNGGDLICRGGEQVEKQVNNVFHAVRR
jgi:hypothetical protein